jgi:thiamine-monophosphate kinase
MDNNKFTPIGSIGEFGLIRELTKTFEIRNESTLKGVGDDAAVLDFKDKQIVVTTDLLTEGVHFDLIYTPLKHLGYKAIAVNLSDVFAMNATPKQVTVAMAVSKKFSLEHLQELYSGMKLACDKYGVDLVGGDTTSSLTGLTISVTAIGEVDADKVVYRTGAQINDLICVSGNLGAAYLGLQLLEREKNVFLSTGAQPKLDDYPYILERQLKPEPRADIFNDLQKLGIKPNAMIDISDGLSSELIHICSQSNVGCRIFQDKIPVDTEAARLAEELNLSVFTCALNGGEDYELLFTVPVKDYDIVKEMPSVSIIGHITDVSEGLSMITDDNRAIELKAQGWNPLLEDKTE